MAIGVFGGTFDPIHNGHLIVAEEVRTQLDLAKILFVPAGQPRLRAHSPLATAEHRLQMLRLAVVDSPYFSISTLEIERAGPSDSVHTMAILRGRLAAEDELFCILGCDKLAQLPRWQEPARLITMCRLAVVPRPGYALPALDSLELAIPGLSQRVILLDKPEIDISASAIRERVSLGLPIGHLVPQPVDEYIRQHKLYVV